MSSCDRLPSVREWLGFAAWVVGGGALIYGAMWWRDRARLHRENPPSVYETETGESPIKATVPARDQGAAFVRPSRPAQRPPKDRQYPFYTIEPDATRGVYWRLGQDGSECIGQNLERGMVLSEYQGNYRAPTSGCGPTAILDWLIWYQNTGLVPRSTRESDTDTYKRITFDLIDRKIAELRGRYRSDFEGTSTMEIIVTFDGLIRELSRGKIRLHCDIKNAPLSRNDLLNQTRYYRAGILIVQVFDPNSSPMGGYHAVVVVRTDTTGRMTLANWGKAQNGRLVQKSDGQWFVTEDDSVPPMKVCSFLTFVPFTPKNET